MKNTVILRVTGIYSHMFTSRTFILLSVHRYWKGVCSLRYKECNAHLPYFRLWSVRLYDMFPHYLVNGTIFGGGLLNIKCVSSLQFCL